LHLPRITTFNGPRCIFELRTNYNLYLPAPRKVGPGESLNIVLFYIHNMRNAYNPKPIHNIWQRYQSYLFFSTC
jgi:hypothetical protein